jgi:lysozyme family protein
MSATENFKWALKVVLHHEGGFVDDRDDPGGATDFGISLRFLQSVLEDSDGDGFADGDIDRDGDIDIDDIRSLDLDDVEKLYKNKFWKKAKCDKIISQLVAVKVFDMAVNMGPSQAWKLVQRACGTLGKTLTVDGKAGTKTLAAVNSLSKKDFMLVVNIRREQDQFYERLILKKPALAKFRLGWRRRAAF